MGAAPLLAARGVRGWAVRSARGSARHALIRPSPPAERRAHRERRAQIRGIGQGRGRSKRSSPCKGGIGFFDFCDSIIRSARVGRPIGPAGLGGCRDAFGVKPSSVDHLTDSTGRDARATPIRSTNYQPTWVLISVARCFQVFEGITDIPAGE